MNALKLNQLEKNHLSQKEMLNLSGGQACGCGCEYKDRGGSSTDDNGQANHDKGVSSDCDWEIVIEELPPIIVTP